MRDPRLFRESHIVRTITLDPRRVSQRGTAEVIRAMLGEGHGHAPDLHRRRDRVSRSHTAVDILLSQPELPIRAVVHGLPLAWRTCLWLTARANLSSDDLAVIRHAFTAVAEVKVRA
ncbi:hypothetical protein OIE66_03310 [Nonomuraea sp. NBC_01738]|uniref:hypothetical protein n=1 Tax=Nonomuraea sp. NBC_01738 TaxID=2976003 RepID=UPI002E16549E|nr:hypothetical protein OIE66_03310 [Nonomuraea sp. NBC_01738]